MARIGALLLAGLAWTAGVAAGDDLHPEIRVADALEAGDYAAAEAILEDLRVRGIRDESGDLLYHDIVQDLQQADEWMREPLEAWVAARPESFLAHYSLGAWMYGHWYYRLRYSVAGAWGATGPPEIGPWLARIEELLVRAARLEPAAAGPWATLIGLRRVRRDWEGANEACAMALDRDAGDLVTLLGVAAQRTLESWDEARIQELIKELEERVPEDPRRHRLAVAYHERVAKRRQGEAARAYLQTAKVKAQLDPARAALEAAFPGSGWRILAEATLRHLSGDMAGAEQVVEQCLRPGSYGCRVYYGRQLQARRDPASHVRARALFREAAEKGGRSDGYQFWGQSLVRGPPDQRDPAKARELFRRAARLGDANGWTMLALMELGHVPSDGPPNPLRARQYFARAARAGGSERVHALAVSLESAEHGPVELETAVELYRRCSPTYRFSTAYLARAYAEGRGVSKDRKRAGDMFRGLPWKVRTLRDLLLYESFFRLDAEQRPQVGLSMAASVLRDAANTGDPSAARFADLLDDLDVADLPVDRKPADAALERGVEAGLDAARWLLAMRIVSKESPGGEARAEALLRESARNDYLAAKVDLGLMLLKRKTESEQREGRRWVEAAVNAGNWEALGYLGWALHEGLGGPKDEVRAQELFRRGSEWGDPYCRKRRLAAIHEEVGREGYHPEHSSLASELCRDGDVTGCQAVAQTFPREAYRPPQDWSRLVAIREAARPGAYYALVTALQLGLAATLPDAKLRDLLLGSPPEEPSDELVWMANVIGDVHLSGNGVPADRGKGLAWYRLAAQTEKNTMTPKEQIRERLGRILVAGGEAADVRSPDGAAIDPKNRWDEPAGTPPPECPGALPYARPRPSVASSDCEWVLHPEVLGLPFHASQGLEARQQEPHWTPLSFYGPGDGYLAIHMKRGEISRRSLAGAFPPEVLGKGPPQSYRAVSVPAPRWLVIGDWKARSMQLFDHWTGSAAGRVQFPGDETTHGVVVSQDGRYVAARRPGSVSVLDRAEPGAGHRIWPGARPMAIALVGSPPRLVVADDQGGLRSFDAVTGVLRRWQPSAFVPARNPPHLSTDPSGEVLRVLEPSGRRRRWTADLERRPGKAADAPAITRLWYSADGTQLVAVDAAAGVRVLDGASGAPLGGGPAPLDLALDVAPLGDDPQAWVAISRSSLWRFREGKWERERHFDSGVRALGVGGDAIFLSTGKGLVRLSAEGGSPALLKDTRHAWACWPAPDGKSLLVPDGPAGVLHISKRGRRKLSIRPPVEVAFAQGGAAALRDRQGGVYLVAESPDVAPVALLPRGATAVALSADGTRVAVALPGVGVLLTEVAETKGPVRWKALPGKPKLTALAFSPDGRKVAWATRSGKLGARPVRMAQPRTLPKSLAPRRAGGRPTPGVEAAPPTAAGDLGPVVSLRVLGDQGPVQVKYRRGDIRSFDPTTGKLSSGPPEAMSRPAILGEAGTPPRWYAVEEHRVQVLGGEGWRQVVRSGGRITTARFRSDGLYLATGNQLQRVVGERAGVLLQSLNAEEFWLSSDATQLVRGGPGRATYAGFTDPVRLQGPGAVEVGFSQSGDRLSIRDEKGVVTVYDRKATWERRYSTAAGVVAAALHPRGEVLALARRESPGVIRFLSLRSLQSDATVLRVAPRPMAAMAYSPSGRTLALAYADGSLDLREAQAVAHRKQTRRIEPGSRPAPGRPAVAVHFPKAAAAKLDTRGAATAVHPKILAGHRALLGEGQPKDEARALAHYREAAAAGIPLAAQLLNNRTLRLLHARKSLGH